MPRDPGDRDPGDRDPGDLVCAHCGRTGTGAAVAGGWAVSRSPRPTGSARARTAEEERTTALCPECARRSVRDLEARL